MKGRRRYKKICKSINFGWFQRKSWPWRHLSSCQCTFLRRSEARRLVAKMYLVSWWSLSVCSRKSCCAYSSYSDVCMASMFVYTSIILVADSIRGREGGIARHHVSVFLQSAHALHAMKPFSSMQASYMQTRKAQQHPPLFRTEKKKYCCKLLVCPTYPISTPHPSLPHPHSHYIPH